VENDRRKKQRKRIWLALLGLGLIIQLNLLFNDSSPVQSATAFLHSMSGEEQKTKEPETTPSTSEPKPDSSQQSNPAQQPNPSTQPKPATPQPVATPPAVPAVGVMVSKLPLPKPTVYLTFDDGPSKYTEAIVGILDKNQVKGAFFWIGENLKTDKQVAFAKQMAANGHVIGTHTMKHEKLRKKPKDTQVAMIRSSTHYVSQKLGIPIYYFRPPYGAVDQNTLIASKETNQILAYWNVDSLDWKYEHKPDLIMHNIASEVKPGSIILLHEKEQTLKLLPKIIELLKNKGYDIAPLPVPNPAKKA
jgi:peptidoglycan/xylan/chitin deacetylase (PgdA/CDA1 family)